METQNLTTNEVKAAKPARSPRIPTKQVDLKNLALRVQPKWKDSGLTLVWKTPTDFLDDIDLMEKSLESKESTVGKRKSNAKDIRDLEKLIDKGVKRVKEYLVFKYSEKDAIAHYDKYGIKKLSNGYRFPTDRDARMESFKLMVAEMEATNPPIDDFGKDFWKNTQAAYAELNKTLTDHAGNISGDVKIKDNAKETVYKVLLSLTKLVEANYPEDFEKVLREWGYQREKN